MENSMEMLHIGCAVIIFAAAVALFFICNTFVEKIFNSIGENNLCYEVIS